MANENNNDEKHLAKRIIKGALLFYIGIFSSRIIGLISTFCLLIYLDDTNFGIAAILLSIWILARSITIADSVNLVVIYRGNDPDYIDTVATQWLAMSFLNAFMILAFSGLLMDFFPQIPSREPFYILAITCILAGLVHPGFATFQRDLRFGHAFRAEIFAKLASVSTGIFFAVIYKNFYAIILGQLAEFFVRALYAGFTYGFKWRFSLASYKQIKKYSIWYFLMSIIGSLSIQVEILLLPMVVMVSDIGIFYIARRISRLIIADIAMAISESVFSGLVKVNHKKELLKEVFLRSVESYGIILLPIGFGLAIIGQDLTIVLFDGKWKEAGRLIVFMGPILALHALTAGTQSFAMANGKFYSILWRESLVLVLKIMLIILGGQYFGFMGAFAGIIISWLAQMLISIKIYKDISSGKMIDYFTVIKRSLSAALCMFLILTFLKPYLLVFLPLVIVVMLNIILGMIIYISLIYLFWIFAKKPKKSIERIIFIQVKIAKHKLKKKYKIKFG